MLKRFIKKEAFKCHANVTRGPTYGCGKFFCAEPIQVTSRTRHIYGRATQFIVFLEKKKINILIYGRCLAQKNLSHPLPIVTKLEEISAAVRINWPIFKRTQESRTLLQRELPAIARAIPAPAVLGKMLVEGAPQERDAYLAHLRSLYRQNQEALDAFWQRHAALKEEIINLV